MRIELTCFLCFRVFTGPKPSRMHRFWKRRPCVSEKSSATSIATNSHWFAFASRTAFTCRARSPCTRNWARCTNSCNRVWRTRASISNWCRRSVENSATKTWIEHCMISGEHFSHLMRNAISFSPITDLGSSRTPFLPSRRPKVRKQSAATIWKKISWCSFSQCEVNASNRRLNYYCSFEIVNWLNAIVPVPHTHTLLWLYYYHYFALCQIKSE